MLSKCLKPGLVYSVSNGVFFNIDPDPQEFPGTYLKSSRGFLCLLDYIVLYKHETVCVKCYLHSSLIALVSFMLLGFIPGLSILKRINVFRRGTVADRYVYYTYAYAYHS